MAKRYAEKLVWRKYLLELLSIFLGVSIAFYLNQWNDNRKSHRTEIKTLLEIRNGLKLDLMDLRDNGRGHEDGLRAVHYMRRLLNNEPVSTTCVGNRFHTLLRDLIAIQNRSAYESLKSKGLDLVQNDSLRLQIISLYDFHYQIVEKLEEEYHEMQFYENYYHSMIDVLAADLEFDSLGRPSDIKQPLTITDEERNKLLDHLHRIEYNRQYSLHFYDQIEDQINRLTAMIDAEVEND